MSLGQLILASLAGLAGIALVFVILKKLLLDKYNLAALYTVTTLNVVELHEFFDRKMTPESQREFLINIRQANKIGEEVREALHLLPNNKTRSAFLKKECID